MTSSNERKAVIGETFYAKTNRVKIIIPTRDESFTFHKTTYREEFLKDFINSHEYNKIIDNASKIMSNSWTKKRLNDQIKLPKFVTVLAILSIVLVVLYTVFLYYSVGSDNGTMLVTVSLICVSFAMLISFALSIYNFCRDVGKFKTIEEIIKEDLDVYLKDVNIKYNGLLMFTYIQDKRMIECDVVKSIEHGEINEKHHSSNEVVKEEDNESEVEESKKIVHSRLNSDSLPKKHSKSSSINENKLDSNRHSRAQSNVVKRNDQFKATEMVSLFNP